ncbi:MAG: peptide ABC transporter substrate-binding protein, partial [Chloroflexota bacterium]|nr:peptide ABC transporter substrate-binding protein [Chloroflexota bacterium]
MIKHIRWQLLLAALGVVLVAISLSYLAVTRTTVLVPAAGGTYIEGLAGRPQYLNPILSQYNDVDRDLCALIFNGLTDINEKGEIVPDLALGWEASDDGLTHTFHLRRGVRWHDGQVFTANDVIFTIRAMQDPDYEGVPYLAELWRSVAVQKLDDYTVQFTLREPYAPFMDYTTVGILPAHLLEEVSARELPRAPFNVRPVGTGPFRAVEVTTAQVTLEANPDYYGHPPTVHHVQFRFYPDHASLLSAYERGEIQGISRVLPQQISRVHDYADMNLYSAQLWGYSIIFLNLNNPDVPFFQEREVRQALLYGLDRQRLVDDVLEGQGIVADSPIMTGSWAYDKDIYRYPYDPAHARTLLAEAGWLEPNVTEQLQREGEYLRERGVGDQDTGESQPGIAPLIREKNGTPLRFVLLTNDDPVHIRLAEEIARQWAEIGVEAIPRVVSFAALTSEHLHPRQFDAVLVDLELTPDPDLYPFWHETQVRDGQNYAGFIHRDASEALEAARQIADQEQRIDLYRQFQEIFAAEVPSLILYHPVYTYGVDQTVRRVQIGPLLDPSDRFRNISDWYVRTQRMIVSEAEYGELDKF